jgi:hypothetical protein
MKFIKKRVVLTVISKAQADFLRKVVEPLEAAINVNYERRIFEYFGKLYKIPQSEMPIAIPSTPSAS